MTDSKRIVEQLRKETPGHWMKRQLNLAAADHIEAQNKLIEDLKAEILEWKSGAISRSWREKWADDNPEKTP